MPKLWVKPLITTRIGKLSTFLATFNYPGTSSDYGFSRQWETTDFWSLSFGSMVSSLFASRPKILFNFRRVPISRLWFNPHSACAAKRDTNCSNSLSVRLSVTFETKLKSRKTFLNVKSTLFDHRAESCIVESLLYFGRIFDAFSDGTWSFPFCVLSLELVQYLVYEKFPKLT